MRSALAAFGVVFLAELGDKTQLVALGLAARHRVAPVIAGVVVAYVVTTTASVIAGGIVGEVVSSDVTAIAAGVIFIGFAIAALRTRSSPKAEVTEIVAESARSVVVSVALAMTVAEFGDKTMLATATLATDNGAMSTWVGAFLGILAAGLIGVAAGRVLGDRVPSRALSYVSAGLFAAFGLVLLAGAWR